jgi:hypothetical protein
LRFTVHRPPCGEVSLCWYRPSGGDVAGCVDVGVARPRFAGNAGEDRLALAVFGCDVPAGGALLRRVRGRNAFESSRGLMVESADQPAPSLTADGTVEAAFLRNPNARLVNRPARRASHCPHIERLDSNSVESARQIGGGLLHPVASPVRFARFQSGNRQSGTSSAVGIRLGASEASLQPAQPGPLPRFKSGSLQQLPGGQCRRNHHTAIDTDHAAIRRPPDRFGDVREGDMPATGPIPCDAIGLHASGHRPRRAESDPPDLGHPDPPVTPIELFDVALLKPDLAEAFVYTGLAPRRATMGAREEVSHGLGKVPQRLLLHRLGSGPQPVVLGADLSQLRRLLVVPRRATARLPPLLLLDGQVPYKPGVPAMFQQHRLLSRRRQQPKPRHTRKLTMATDTNGPRALARIVIGVAPWRDRGSFQPKEDQ